MVRQALILAGGRGAMEDNLVKAMLPIGGRPFLEYLVSNLRRFGIDTIILSVGYGADAIARHFGDGRAFGVTMIYRREAYPGGIRHALDVLDERFLVLNGDILFDCNYLDVAMLLESGPQAAIALRQADDTSRAGHVVCTGNRVEGFGKMSRIGPGWRSAGVYALTRHAVASLPPGAGSIEQVLFPALAARGELAAKVYPGFFLDIGLPENVLLAECLLAAWQRKPCVFLDRDGVLNTDLGYVYRPEAFQWIDGAIEAVKWCNDCGYLTVVVTNQSGIARGIYDTAAFWGLTAWMQDVLRAHGAHLDAVYHCPHHPTEGNGPFTGPCACRKPAGGLVRQALADWPIDPARSLIVGDKPSDLAAGAACGIPGELFAGGNLLEFLQRFIRPLWIDGRKA